MDTASVEAALRLRPSFGHELRWSGEPARDRADAAAPSGPATTRSRSRTMPPTPPGWRSRRRFSSASDGRRRGWRSRRSCPPTVSTASRPLRRSPSSSIGRSIPPRSTRGCWSITPELAGTLEVVALPDDPASTGRRRSAPSLHAVRPAPAEHDVRGRAGGRRHRPGGRWWHGRAGELELHDRRAAGRDLEPITFITDRAGVANVWAMNADGTGQRQVSAELHAHRRLRRRAGRQLASCWRTGGGSSISALMGRSAAC